jgi:hypothetical protein
MGTPAKGVFDVSDSVMNQTEVDFYNAVVDYLSDLRTRYNATLTKLDNDATVTDTNYNALNAILDPLTYVKK